MEMQTLINYIITYASMWAPAVTAVIGIIVLFIKGFKTIKNTVTEIKDEQSIKDLKSEVENQNMINKQIRDELRTVTEQLQKVKDYGLLKETVNERKD